MKLRKIPRWDMEQHVQQLSDALPCDKLMPLRMAKDFLETTSHGYQLETRLIRSIFGYWRSDRGWSWSKKTTGRMMHHHVGIKTVNAKLESHDDRKKSTEESDWMPACSRKWDHLSMKLRKIPWWDMEQSDPYTKSVVQVDEEDCPHPSRLPLGTSKDNCTPTTPGNTTWNHDSLDAVAIR
jgi:hypothetical protein